MSNAISSPILPGERAVIPAGTLLRSMNPRHEGLQVAARRRTVVVDHVLRGWVDLWGDHGAGRGLVVLPSIRWPGSGGYWQEAQLTAELLAANGAPALVLPVVDPHTLAGLDVEPSAEDGYTNRWLRPA